MKLGMLVTDPLRSCSMHGDYTSTVSYDINYSMNLVCTKLNGHSGRSQGSRAYHFEKAYNLQWPGSNKQRAIHHTVPQKQPLSSHYPTETATTSMMFVTPIAVAALALAASVHTAPTIEKRTAGDFGLAIPGGNFDINYLQTFDVYYANNGAFLGEIKYQLYSEPLILSGAGSTVGFGSGLTFSSIHSTANGAQQGYIVPHQTQPIGFSVPHGTPPAGVKTAGFAFDGSGTLTHNGLNRFYACQDASQAAINTYQIWWWGAGKPNGVSCKGPIHLKQVDSSIFF
jgi:hypothetical protein